MCLVALKVVNEQPVRDCSARECKRRRISRLHAHLRWNFAALERKYRQTEPSKSPTEITRQKRWVHFLFLSILTLHQLADAPPQASSLRYFEASPASSLVRIVFATSA